MLGMTAKYHYVIMNPLQSNVIAFLQNVTQTTEVMRPFTHLPVEMRLLSGDLALGTCLGIAPHRLPCWCAVDSLLRGKVWTQDDIDVNC